jgi:hypothetical protein
MTEAFEEKENREKCDKSAAFRINFRYVSFCGEGIGIIIIIIININDERIFWVKNE